MLPQDGPVLAALFAFSIEELTGEDYGPAQQAAWIGMADDEEAFANGLARQLTIVALSGPDIVGFASLQGTDRLAMLYVRPDAAREGVGTTLSDAIEKLATSRGAKALLVDASDTAQPFFAQRGYEALRRETVPLGDEWLGRTVMRKTLSAGGDAP
jgi:putative acetyltransferase